MPKIIFLFLAILPVTMLLHAQTNDYNITITLKPCKNTPVYLGYYYGKTKALADSAYLDNNGTGSFKGKKKLNPGIYFIVDSRYSILFELLIDRQQQFSIIADSTDLPASIQFKNSPDNSIYQQYILNSKRVIREIEAINEALSHSLNDKDAALLRGKLKRNEERITHYRDSLIKKYPTSFLAALFRVSKVPDVPPASRYPGGRYDSTYAYQYFKTHYWDGISFTDDRLIRTPMLEPRLDKYYATLVPPNPDSISREADRMLELSRPNAEMFKYLMVYLVQKYINPDFMGEDVVFVHLFQRYINTGQAEFFTDVYKKYMSDRAYSLMSNLIGMQAPELIMTDTLGNITPLSKVEATFTILVFWDPACDHCKEVVSGVDSIHQARWKYNGVKIYGVLTEGGRDNWLKFIREKNLDGWIHVYQTEDQKTVDMAAGRPGYRQLYDVRQTPVLYLLDKDKHILAKHITYTQIDEIMQKKRRESSN